MLCTFLFVLWLGLSARGGDAPSKEEYQLASAINAIYGLLQFYARDYTDLNVDGLFGLRLIEGQLKVIAAEFDAGKYTHVSKDVQRKIVRAGSEAGKLANKAIPHTFEKDQQYFTQFKHWVNVPYTIIPDQMIPVDPKLWWDESKKCEKMVGFDEEQSDLCIAEIFDAVEKREAESKIAEDPMKKAKRELAPERKPKSDPKKFEWGDCKFSKWCLERFLLEKGCKDYTLTHQIIFTSVAEQLNCLPALDKYVKLHAYKNGIDDWRKEFCSNLFLEINRILRESGGSIHALEDGKSRDLLMEIVFTCGQFGFFEFATLEYLEAFLSWQSDMGCYTDQKVPNQGKRQLLFEDRIKTDGCLSHMSAVAAGALTIMLRLILTPLPKEWAHLHLTAQKHSPSFDKIATFGMFVNFTKSNLNYKPELEEDVANQDKIEIDSRSFLSVFMEYYGMTLVQICVFVVLVALLCGYLRKKRKYRYLTTKILVCSYVVVIFIVMIHGVI